MLKYTKAATKVNQFIKYFLLVLAAAAILFLLWYFQNIVAFILVSAVLSLTARPLVDWLIKIRLYKWHISKTIAALLTLLTIWFIVFLFFRIFIPLIINQANQFSNLDLNQVTKLFEIPIQRLEYFMSKLNADNQYQFSLQAYLTGKLATLLNVSMISNFFGSIAGIMGNIFLAFFSISFITFFFLRDENLFVEALMAFVPIKYEVSFRHVLNSIKKLLTRYFLGIAIEITGIIILVTIGLTIVGIGFGNSLVIGLIAGILNVIPYIGPIIGAIIGIILGLATQIYMGLSPEMLQLVLYMATVFIITQIIDNIVFQPLIYSSSVHAHPLEIFLVILIAGSLAGIAGMILAIPVYTIIRVFAKEFFNNFKLVKKLTQKI